MSHRIYARKKNERDLENVRAICYAVTCSDLKNKKQVNLINDDTVCLTCDVNRQEEQGPCMDLTAPPNLLNVKYLKGVLTHQPRITSYAAT